MDFIEKIPDKEIVLELPPREEFSIDEMKMYQEKFAGFRVALHNMDGYQILKENGINWYWPYPVTSYFELTKIIELEPEYILLGQPLTFDLPKIKEKIGNIKLRMIVNNALPEYLLTSHETINIEGSYVRPEDVELYDAVIDMMEFEVDYGNYRKEETLLKVYKSGTWPGNLNILIDNLNTDVDNRAIDPSFGEIRMRCGQRCLKSKTCRFCVNAIILANNVRSYKYEMEKNNTN